MQLIEVTEIKKKKRARAGIYPVFIDQNGQMWVCLMIPSDPAYGGPQPQMGKGRVDDGQTNEEAAVREGEEELGLRRDNMGKVELITRQTIAGLQTSYDIYVYSTIVEDPKAFDEPHYESSWAGFLEIDDAIARTRSNQRPFLEMVKTKYEV
jgi:8-oxo-dGTP pyrophosphatase MutT (NUDIX family)